MSYSSYFCVAHKNARTVYPGRYWEASWNLVGSKTFGIYLAKWRHPSWKWPVRHSAVAGKCKLSNIYMGWFAWRRWAPWSPTISYPTSFRSRTRSETQSDRVYSFAILSARPYRSRILWSIIVDIIRMELWKHLCFYRWTVKSYVVSQWKNLLNLNAYFFK